MQRTFTTLEIARLVDGFCSIERLELSKQYCLLDKNHIEEFEKSNLDVDNYDLDFVSFPLNGNNSQMGEAINTHFEAFGEEGSKEILARLLKYESWNNIPDGYFILHRHPKPEAGTSRINKYFQFKADQPLRDQEDKIRKYISPKGVPAFPFYSAYYDWANHPVDKPIYLIEGAKKARYLISLGYAAISISGVNTGLEVGEVSEGKKKKGVAQNDKNVKKSLKIIPYNTVVLCFDSDVETNKQVFEALKKQAKAYLKDTERDYEVLVCQWDKKLGKGIDDVGYDNGNEIVRKILDNPVPFKEWENRVNLLYAKKESEDKKQFEHILDEKQELADYLRNLAIEKGDWVSIGIDKDHAELYRYTEGFWEKVSKKVFRSYLSDTAEKTARVNSKGSIYLIGARERYSFADVHYDNWTCNEHLFKRLNPYQLYAKGYKYFHFANNLIWDLDRNCRADVIDKEEFVLKTEPTHPIKFDSDYKRRILELKELMRKILHHSNDERFETQWKTLTSFARRIVDPVYFKERQDHSFLTITGIAGSGKGTIAEGLLSKLSRKDIAVGSRSFSNLGSKEYTLHRMLDETNTITFSDEKGGMTHDEMASFIIQQSAFSVIEGREIKEKSKQYESLASIVIASTEPLRVNRSVGEWDRRVVPITTYREDANSNNELRVAVENYLDAFTTYIVCDVSSENALDHLKMIHREMMRTDSHEAALQQVESDSVAGFIASCFTVSNDPEDIWRVNELYKMYRAYVKETTQVKYCKGANSFGRDLGKLISNLNYPLAVKHDITKTISIKGKKLRLPQTYYGIKLADELIFTKLFGEDYTCDISRMYDLAIAGSNLVEIKQHKLEPMKLEEFKLKILEV